MRKNLPLLIVLALLVTWSLLRIFHVIDIYKVSSMSMEPNYSLGERIYASSLKSPEYNSVVTYRSKAIPRPGIESEEGVFVGRIIGKERDEVEIIDGHARVNGQAVDLNTPLKFAYFIGQDQINRNLELLAKLKIEEIIQVKDSMLVYLTDEQKEEFIGKEQLTKYDRVYIDIDQLPAKDLIREGWSQINYGPVLVPEDHYFIIGDNRFDSEDSRIKGFVHVDDIISTVIN